MALCPSSAHGVIFLVVKLVSKANGTDAAGVPVIEDGSVALEMSMFSVCKTDFGKIN